MMAQPAGRACYKLVPVPLDEVDNSVSLQPAPQPQQWPLSPQQPQQPIQPFGQPMTFPNLVPSMTDLQDNVNRLHQQMALQFPAPMPLMTPPLMTSPMGTSPLMTSPMIAPSVTAPTMAFPALPMPIVRQDERGRRIVELKLDVGGYNPEDIRINTDGQMLEIYARSSNVRKDGVSDSSSRSEFRRQFTLPEPVNAENLRCVFNNDGSVTIQGEVGGQRALTQKKPKHVTFALCNDS